MRVNHNISSMTALRHLGNTSNATDKNLERLSSGLKSILVQTDLQIS